MGTSHELTDERFFDWFNSRPCMAVYQAVEDAESDLEGADDTDALDDAAERLAQARAVFDDVEEREVRAQQLVIARAAEHVSREAEQRRMGVGPIPRARSGCGGRRRPGRRAVSRSAGGGSDPHLSGDDDPPGEHARCAADDHVGHLPTVEARL
jgi:hypothetical protein